MGGAVAVEFALARPERVAGLVCVAAGVAGFPWDQEDPLGDEADAAERAGDIDRAIELNRQIWAPLRTDPETDDLIDRMMRENTGEFDIPDEWWLRPDPPAVDRLEEIASPTLIVMGDTDHPKIFAVADALTSRIPGARRVDIAQADHLIPLRQPQAFNQSVLAFLEEIGER
jgi:pimeloyl-ACP methyl ester carboxylesterase